MDRSNARRHSATAIIQVSETKIVAVVDQAIADYYRALIPRWIPTNPQKYPAHISVVRREEFDRNLAMRYEGEEIQFEYDIFITNDETYYWLNVESPRIQEIRVALGLKPFPWWRNKFHITVANVKGSV